MSKESEPKKQNQPDYGFYVKQYEGQFTLMIPEIGIARRHKNLDEGFKELMVAQENYFKDVSDSKPKLSRLKHLKSNFIEKKSSNSAIVSFFLKSLIAILLILGFGSISAIALGNIVGKNISRAVLKIEGELLAVPDEKIQQYAKQIKPVGKKLKPILREFNLLWKESEALKINPENND